MSTMIRVTSTARFVEDADTKERLFTESSFCVLAQKVGTVRAEKDGAWFCAWGDNAHESYIIRVFFRLESTQKECQISICETNVSCHLILDPRKIIATVASVLRTSDSLNQKQKQKYPREILLATKPQLPTVLPTKKQMEMRSWG